MPVYRLNDFCSGRLRNVGDFIFPLQNGNRLINGTAVTSFHNLILIIFIPSYSISLMVFYLHADISQ